MSKGGRHASEADAIARPVVEALGYDLVDTDFIREGPNQILRYYIDKRGGIGIDDCETVSRAVDPLLDEQFSYQKAYYLEVSSPGLTRPLKTASDFDRYVGETVEVSLYRRIDGHKQFDAEMLGSTDDGFRLLVDGREISFSSADVAKVVRKIEF